MYPLVLTKYILLKIITLSIESVTQLVSTHTSVIMEHLSWTKTSYTTAITVAMTGPMSDSRDSNSHPDLDILFLHNLPLASKSKQLLNLTSL